MISPVTPYRTQLADRLRKLYQRHWVEGKDFTADEAEWVLRAACELEGAPRTLSPAAMAVAQEAGGPVGTEDERMPRVRELLQKGLRAEAIRLYRAIHGCSLLEARDACLGPR